MSDFRKWNGSAWVDAENKRWNGSSWVDAYTYKWNGSSWIQIYPSGIITPTLTLDKNIDENTGEIIDDYSCTMYSTVDLIPVNPGSKYTLHISTALWMDVYEYGNSGNYIKCTTITQNSVSNFSATYTAPSNCNYIRVFVLSPNATPVLTITAQ